MQSLDPKALKASAEAGDRVAQYRLAALFMAQPDGQEEALHWLSKAAASGHPEARFTLAGFLLKGQVMPIDPDRAVTILEQNARDMHPASVHIVASFVANGFGCEKNWSLALDMVIELAKSGAPTAMRELAMLLVYIGGNRTLADRLFFAAATRGDILAVMPLARAYEAGAGGAAMASFVKTALIVAEEAGHPIAGALAAAIDADPLEEKAGHAPIPDYEASVVKGKILEALSMGAPIGDVVSDRPRARQLSNFLEQDLADYLIGQAAPRLHGAMLFDGISSQWVKHPARRLSEFEFWPEDSDLVTSALAEKLCQVAGYERHHGELLVVQRLDAGDHWAPHFDAFQDGDPSLDIELEKAGQRRSTVILPLGKECEGGDVRLCSPDITVDLPAGSGLVIDNVLVDGSVDDQAMYEVLPIKSGRYWQAHVMVREKSFKV